MTEEIAWYVELTVKTGQLANFLALTGEMAEATRAEEGVLSYQRFVTEDGQSIHLYEKYVDADAAVSHLRRFIESFGERFSSMVERRRFTVFGAPGDELRAMLVPYGAIFLEPLGSFAYWSG
jgi:quinol monooxygenase YgiN